MATQKKTAGQAKDFVARHRETDAGELYGITELAKESGLSPRAIRFYEDKGLLAPQRVNGGRAYTRRDRVRLMLIQRGKAMGLALSEIQAILDLYGEQGEGHAKQLNYIIDKIDASVAELESRRAHIDATLAELKVIRADMQAALESRRKK